MMGEYLRFKEWYFIEGVDNRDLIKEIVEDTSEC